MGHRQPHGIYDGYVSTAKEIEREFKDRKPDPIPRSAFVVDSLRYGRVRRGRLTHIPDKLPEDDD